MLRHQKWNEETEILEGPEDGQPPQHGTEKKIWKWIPERPASKTLFDRFLVRTWVHSLTSLSLCLFIPGTEMMKHLALMAAVQGECQEYHDQKVPITASPGHLERTGQMQPSAIASCSR